MFLNSVNATYLVCYPNLVPCSAKALLFVLLSLASTLDSVRALLGGGALSCYPHLFLPIALLVTPCSRRRQADLYFLLPPIPEELHKETNSRFRGSEWEGGQSCFHSVCGNSGLHPSLAPLSPSLSAFIVEKNN